MATKKKTASIVTPTLPKGDKAISRGVTIICERGHSWYVVPETEEVIFEIFAGCNTWEYWEDAFDHYKLRNWYVHSEYAKEESYSDVHLEEVRLRCIQRLQYMKHEYESAGNKSPKR
jgi:hypothetical protein